MCSFAGFVVVFGRPVDWPLGLLIGVAVVGSVNKSGKLVLKLHKRNHVLNWQKLRALT